MEQPEGEQKSDLDVFVSELLAEKGLADSAEAHAELLKRARERVYMVLLAWVPLQEIDKLEYYAGEGSLNSALLEKAIEKAGVDVEKTVDYALARVKKKFLEEE